MLATAHLHWPVHLRTFCLAHAEAFLVPAEALAAGGLAADFAAALAQAGVATAAQLERLSQGFALYWQRCAALHERAPQWWFAPRATNVLVVREPADAAPGLAPHVAPYVVPFAGTSSLLYLSDLDTEAEFVAYLFAHNERLPLVGSLRGSHLANLSWWLLLDAPAQAAFARAARAARRPDAAAFAALADALPLLDTAFHDPLRLPGSKAAERGPAAVAAPAAPEATSRQEPAAPAHPIEEPYFGLTGTGLALPQRHRASLERLCAMADRAQAHAVAAQRPTKAVRAATLDRLCDWLREQRAHLDITAADGTLLWRAGGRDPSALRATLRREATDAAAASLAQDFAVVHERSVAFLGALSDPEALPTHCGVLERGGSAYIEPARRAVVVPLRAAAFNPLVHAAPPYHRLLLGARVMHEWGHLAHAAKILHLPEAHRERYRGARQRLGAAFLQLLQEVPPALQAPVQRELGELVAAFGATAAGTAKDCARGTTIDPAAALARKTLARVGDYLANMMCARLIPPAEMQAYVRTNVRHHLEEELGLVSELARYAYEVHYLPLAGLPRSYFFESSRFRRTFIDSGAFAEAGIQTLFDAAGEVLACYAVDTARLRLPTPAPAPALVLELMPGLVPALTPAPAAAPHSAQPRPEPAPHFAAAASSSSAF
jgi:hypothetical protein